LCKAWHFADFVVTLITCECEKIVPANSKTCPQFADCPHYNICDCLSGPQVKDSERGLSKLKALEEKLAARELAIKTKEMDIKRRSEALLRQEKELAAATASLGSAEAQQAAADEQLAAGRADLDARLAAVAEREATSKVCLVDVHVHM
jgi:hypothetical protein